MKLPSENTNITLDDLLGLVETAIHTIDRLQTENAFLARQLHESEDAARTAAAEANSMAAQLRELERATLALKTDAAWRTWFCTKYGNSTFFTYVEKEYLNDHPQAGDRPTAIVRAGSRADTQRETNGAGEKKDAEAVQDMRESA